MNRRMLLAYALETLCCVIGMAYIGLHPLNRDAALFLQIAERMLHGDRLYQDIVISNTPFIIYYSAIPALLARALAISLPVAFLACAFALLYACAVFSLYLFTRNPAWRRPIPLAFLSTVLPLLLFCSPSFGTDNDFGQREHFFFALFLPYALVSLNALQGMACSRRVRIFAGVLGLLGCVIKPHFLLFLLASEGYLMWRAGRWQHVLRAEALVIGIGFAAANLAVPLLYPAYLKLIPDLAAQYRGYELPMADFLLTALIQCIVLLVGLVLLLRLMRRAGSPLARESGYLSALVVAGFGSYMLHKAGFFYQSLPMWDFFWLLCVYVLLHAGLGRHDPKYFLATVLAGWLLAVRPAMSLPELPGLYAAYRHDARIYGTLRAQFDGQTAALLSTSMLPGHPAMEYAGLRDVARSPILFYIPAYYIDQRDSGHPAHYHVPAAMPDTERRYFDMTVDDIVTRKPGLLMVSTAEQKQGLHGMDFDLLAYFRQDARFRQAFAAYHRVDSPFRDMALYRRGTK